MPIEMPEMPPAVAAALATGLPRFAVAASPPAEGAAAPLLARPSITRSGPNGRSSRTIARAIETALESAAADGADGLTGAHDANDARGANGTAGVGAPMVVMGLEELAQGLSPRQTTARLWLQLLPAGSSGQRAMAEVDQASGRLTSVSEGADVKALSRQIDKLTAAAAPAAPLARGARSAATPRQELALIRVPALHLTAVWLKGDGDGGADDVVIPNDGPIAPLVPGRHYPLADFQALVQAMAAERIARTGDDMGG